MGKEQYQEKVSERLRKEKGGICISIIVPTHRLSPERRADPLQTEKAILRAGDYLRNNHSSKEIDPLLSSLDELYSGIDFNRNASGIGLFVSSGMKWLVQFYFPVKEKVIIAGSFEIRDLLYQDYYSIPYIVLQISEKSAKLLQGSIDSLQEIEDNNFPKKYEDQYEYSKPSRGSSYVGHAFTKGFEKDKSQLEQIRYEDFLAHVDSDLNSYLTNGTCLVVAGAIKDLSCFNKVSRHTKSIAGQVPGNYDYTPVSELGRLTWDNCRSFLDDGKAKLIREFEEKIGTGYGITGIRDAWKAAKEGRGLKLLVEKDFSLPGFLAKNDEYHLYLRPPKQPHFVLADVVNDLIETVLDRNGNVIFVENDALKDHQRVALITRY